MLQERGHDLIVRSLTGDIFRLTKLNIRVKTSRRAPQPSPLELVSGLGIQQVHFGEDVDVRYADVDHDAERGHRAGDELAALYHEGRIDQEHAAQTEVQRLATPYSVRPQLNSDITVP